MKFNLLIYHFRFNIYCAMFLRNVCLPQSHEDTVLDFLLESLLLYFPLMYLWIYLKLIFVYCVR